VSRFAARLAAAVAGTALAERFAVAAPPFLERRGGDAAAEALEGPVLVGLARLLATEPQVGGFLSHRPALLERIGRARTGALEVRARELEQAGLGAADADLEQALDRLRVLRREETCIAACLDLGGAAPFGEVSLFLSVLAESITRQTFELAQRALGASADPALSVIAMGKLAGREFTYHSDLDLIFLHGGRPEEAERPSRLAQRLIAYLTTMTGAGVAYAVDARLRPSGQQGALVTTFDGFERYQTREAETWEHVALLRARPIAGEIRRTEAVLESVRRQLLERAQAPWAYLADLRARVEAERADESGGAIAFKTGPGGLMDVDFLAAGALLERGAGDFPALPSVSAMLRAAADGAGVEALLDDYRFLRLLEARARWCAGRAVESLDADPSRRSVVAELLEPGLGVPALEQSISAARRRVRAAWRAVTEGGSIAALETAAA
jgi:glutamate-ammonia-ligase adenylyltransferase